MRRHIVVAVGLLSLAGSIWADSGVTFNLGLAVEYLSDEQTYTGVSTERSNFQTVIGLALSGHLLDPRFVTFDASVTKALSDLSLSDQPDSEVDETYYTGAFRFFNNRPVSLEIGAGRQGTDTSGLSQGAVVDGVRDYQRYAIRAIGGDWFRANLRHSEQSFTADEPDTLRDEDVSWTEVTAQATAGKVGALAQLLWNENDLFDGGLQQEIGSGRLDVDINRAGRVYWHTDLIGNLYRSAQYDGPFSPWTTNYLLRNQLRHRYSQLGFWDARADLRVVKVDSDPAEELITGDLSASLVAPLNPSAFLEAEVGYLSNEYGDGLRVNRPRAGVGLRWGQEYGGWWVSVNPRVTYAEADSQELEKESSFGSMVFASVRRQLERSSVTVEIEYFDNQLSIPDYEADGPLVGSSFLAGLDLRRHRGRLIFDFRPTHRTGFTVEGDYRSRVRLDRGVEITETLTRAQMHVLLGTVVLGASGDRFELDGGELPILTDVWQANIAWAPAFWLTFDALVRTEERRLFDAVGRYDFAELGMRFNYAKLAFYARAREQRTEEAGNEQRRFRRVWVGVRRLFTLRIGDNPP